MIVFDLHCEAGHRFEGWFGSSGDFDTQRSRGLVTCPECGSSEVGKAPMAPAVTAKGSGLSTDRKEAPGQAEDAQPISNREMPVEVQNAFKALADAQSKALANSTWVGDRFAEQSRAMHYGEREEAAIHGRASLEEAKSLLEEGVPVAPLPFPVAPPDELN